MPNPYLSIVAVSRNDDHGGQMHARMCKFVEGVLYWTRLYDWDAELILVDWNPPADRPPLAEALPQPGPDDRLTVRYITVPPELHNAYRLSDVLGLFQMTGKNVGIRRARGQYILCTNVDVIFSKHLAEWLGQKQLEPGYVYRANRADVPADMVDAPLDNFDGLAWPRALRVLGKNGRYPYFTGSVPSWLFKKKDWYRTLLLNLIHGWHKRYYHEYKYSEVDSKTSLLDTMACGDFKLMSKADWESIEGYMEADLYSLHIDSLGLGMAVAKGIEQKILPGEQVIFHLDHANSWEALDDYERLTFTAKKPSLAYSDVWQAVKKMVETGVVPSLNGPDWGYAQHDLPEVVQNERYA